MTTRESHQEGSILDTLQSLIVAFVLAMTFRGFVTEGFVIPTGSMAPTLMGQHLRLHSRQTGYEFAIDAKQVTDDRAAGNLRRRYDIRDPMLGEEYAIASEHVSDMPRQRMGDRILVLKSLYPFHSPRRYDVVVFKNPTDPDGEAENYIKRLVGLPGESIWLVDGDVFAWRAEDARNYAEYRVQRKPEHVQRAVWQPVCESDYLPQHPATLAELSGGRIWSAPWSGEGWRTESVRSYRCDTAEPTVLNWRRVASDWTAYNMITRAGILRGQFPVGDLRVRASLVADSEGLGTTLELECRGHLFQFTITSGQATMRLRPLEEAAWSAEQSADVEMPRPGRVYDVEFWHADQAMTIYVNGRRAGEPLYYDWNPPQRIERTYGKELPEWQRLPPETRPPPPQIRWRFEGSPVTLSRVGVDRDLYYQPARLRHGQRNPPFLDGPAFGTHPDNLAILGPHHFFMLGDNSPASLDSRLWGSPHPLVATQIDPAPFVVHRRLLLGKAWVVYFPSPYGLGEESRAVIPDFGRLRFIR